VVQKRSAMLATFGAQKARISIIQDWVDFLRQETSVNSNVTLYTDTQRSLWNFKTSYDIGATFRLWKISNA
jgi:hypothetical protein